MVVFPKTEPSWGGNSLYFFCPDIQSKAITFEIVQTVSLSYQEEEDPTRTNILNAAWDKEMYHIYVGVCDFPESNSLKLILHGFDWPIKGI